MAMASNRPFGAPTFPASPAPTTASSLNYSQYGGGQFVSPSRQHAASMSISSGYGAPGQSGSQRDRPNPQRSQTEALPAKPLSGRKMESKEVAKVHWRALREFLSEWLQKESPTARQSAREKLTRLTKLQFQELSTDVYDELMRRTDIENGVTETAPFLPVRDDFHPKRNQARQKLATLPKNRFKDLASDVFYELRRRYPEFNEAEMQESLQDDEPPPAPGPVHQRPPFSSSQSAAQLRDRERPRDGPTPPLISRLNSAGHQREGSRNISAGSSVGSGIMDRSRPSLDNNRFFSHAQPTAATNDIVVPVKSRMKEEEIQVPYARESVMDRPLSTSSSRQSLRSSTQDPRDRSGARTPKGEAEREEVLSPQTNDDRDYYDRISFSSNLTKNSRAPGALGLDEDRERKIRAEYEVKIAGLERRVGQLENEKDELQKSAREEKTRGRDRDDEARSLKERAGLHASNLRALQHELDLARDAAEAARRQTEQTGRQAQDEINQWRDRCEGLEDEVRRLEVEISALQSAGSTSGGHSGDAVDELKKEIHSLVDELNALSANNDDLIAARERDAQVMNEMEAKVEEYKRKHDAVRIELRNLKATSTMFVSKPLNDDHLPASPDGNIADVHVSAFQTAIDGMLQAARSSTPSGVLPAMKAIVEAITEIGEDVKTFEAKPNLDVDVSRLESLKHESTARLNNLMQAARNHAMASGLSPVSLIDAAAGHLTANVVEIIKLLKIRRTSKSPVPNGLRRTSRSSMSIKDMVDRSRGAGTPTEPKSIPVARNDKYGTEERLRESGPTSRQLSVDDGRMASPLEMDRSRNGSSSGGMPGMMSNLRINSYQSATSSIARSDSFDLERKASIASASDRNVPRPNISVSTDRDRYGNGLPGQSRYGRTSEASQTSGSSAVMPVTAETGGDEYHEESEVFSNEGGNDQEWEDVKPYLETQSSALVNSIQNLLAAIRTGTHTPALNEHLSEVIAIASSIVAISTNALPTALRGEGGPLLRDLVANTNRLSEAQEQAKGGPGFDKTVRQVIASASFGVAKSLKAIMKLGTE